MQREFLQPRSAKTERFLPESAEQWRAAWNADMIEALRLVRPMELRIDVRLHPDDVDSELEKLYRRLHTPGDCLQAC